MPVSGALPAMKESMHVAVPRSRPAPLKGALRATSLALLALAASSVFLETVVSRGYAVAVGTHVMLARPIVDTDGSPDIGLYFGPPRVHVVQIRFVEMSPNCFPAVVHHGLAVAREAHALSSVGNAFTTLTGIAPISCITARIGTTRGTAPPSACFPRCVGFGATFATPLPITPRGRPFM